MSIDWRLVTDLAGPIIALFLGIWANRKFESRPLLVSYYSHISAFLTIANGQPVQVHTHAVVLRNNGRRSANNVRLHHLQLPNFSIWPAVVHRTEDLPDGSRDIVIPVLVPGEEITISYLYFPPLLATGINAGIKSDEGFAQQVPVLLQRQYPPWVNRLAAWLLLIGLIGTIYLIFAGATWLFRRTV